jgi:uncharacterized membrane protein YebE (DUF533 family)
MQTHAKTGRASSAGRGRYVRSTSTPRRSIPTQGLRRHRQPQKSGLQKAIGALLPAAAAKKAAPSSKKGKAGGLALVAAAAGMAFKNRGKLNEMRRKDSGATPTTPTGVDNASTPTV